MPPVSLSVAERITSLKAIFNDFGIPVHDNSVLDRCINNEFGRGKRSELTQILTELQTGADVGELATCIGVALEKHADDPQLVTIGKVMRERLPSLFNIIDIRQQTDKRVRLLEQLLLHFEHKLAVKPEEVVAPDQVERLLRMLASARAQLRNSIELQSIGMVLEDSGTVFNLTELRRNGRIVRGVIPALLALDQPDIEYEQKINLCVQAMFTIGKELNDSKIIRAARIIDNIHWLARVSLPAAPDHATIEQALRNLGLPLGSVTIHQLRNKAQKAGLNEKEVAEMLYAGKDASGLLQADQDLLAATKENRQYAAACGLLTKLAQDINCQELEHAGVAGMCLISMRQTYYEFKTSNLNAINFSETLGIFLSGIGVLTKNDQLAQIGTCILEGVGTYMGLMAVPGGAYVAVPLAICSVLSKIMINKRSQSASADSPSAEQILQQILGQIVKLQLEMRRQFACLYNLLQEQHKQLLVLLDQGFSSLANCLQAYNFHTIAAVQLLDQKLDAVHYHLGKEFLDLYLEYIRDPIEELQFFSRYRQGDQQKLQTTKIKLSMWLLFKSTHRKVNGRDLVSHLSAGNEMSVHVAQILRKTNEYDAVLGLINHYVNIEFQQTLPEELPHVPTWLLAADRYIYLLDNYQAQMAETEPQVIKDIQKVGVQMLSFVIDLARNDALLQDLNRALQQQCIMAQNEVLQLTNGDLSLYGYKYLRAKCFNAMQNKVIIAYSAPQPQQLEIFDPCNLDITELWRNNFAAHIPVEFHLAENYELGNLQVSFAIDPNVNRFAHVHTHYSTSALADGVRDVLYRIDVSFKSPTNPHAYNLLTAWFAYDLVSSCKRFEEYYRSKFKYPLKHARYLWISLDGMRNQVEDNGETDTHKLINYTRLAELYKKWWSLAQPVNAPDVMIRVVQNSGFSAQYRSMLERGDFFNLNLQNILSLQFQLQSQIQQKVLVQRQNVASKLQASAILPIIFGKIDAYLAIVTAFGHLLNDAQQLPQVSGKFAEILTLLLKPGTIQVNFAQELANLFHLSQAVIVAENYQQGLFYQKISHTVTRLQLLLNSVAPTVRLYG